LKHRIAEIQAKDVKDRTKDEQETLTLFEERRYRKNGRSRERAMERKSEYDKIISAPEKSWTKEQKLFVQETMVAKYKKNEGDRMRRKRLKYDVDGQSCMGDSQTFFSNDTSEESSKMTKSISIHNSGNTKSSNAALPKPSKKKAAMNRNVATTSASASVSEGRGPERASSKRKTPGNIGIPGFIESTNQHDPSEKDLFNGNTFFQIRDEPLTPVNHREEFALLHETPTNFFGNSPNGNKQSLEFSPNVIFPSPRSKNTNLNMDAIDFDVLELPMDGVSILDPSMAMGIDDDVMFSPHLHFNPPTLSYNTDLDPPTADQHAMPSLTSSTRQSPLNLPRRVRHQHDMDWTAGASHFRDFNPTTTAERFHGEDHRHSSGSGPAAKAIAVSFSVDTA